MYFMIGKGWWRSNHARVSVDLAVVFLGNDASESQKTVMENGCF
jgi:hypothetical protein